ncbi:OmpA family protein [Flaviaesturariibacter flavus]|uniref:OmpA family protein n=1 Tax=Flaviaesturariibacter flavus TaxID=2502780 RepID=A0A4R1BBC7_9BACT|nr:OmpA family protein [Flaviaesturariibacter flavus]TCJ14290.1 OmpA family protein [Flaviaesturariibacter flavus]
MAFNLLDSVRSLFNHEVVSKVAPSLGESEGGVGKALAAIIPLLFGGVLSRVHAGEAASMLDVSRNVAAGGPANALRGLATGDTQSLISRGTDLVRNLFGTHHDAVGSVVARHAGVHENSARSLLALAAPVALGRLGEHAEENHMRVPEFSSFLESQRVHIEQALPSGLSLSAIPGLSGLTARDASVTGVPVERTHRTVSDSGRVTPEHKPGGSKWLLPVIIILAILALLYLFSRGCNRRDTDTNTGNTTMTTPVPVQTDTSTIRTPGAGARTYTKVRLANGTELNAYAGGVEEQLVNCINDASCKAGKDKWFDFDNINFEVGSARLTPESRDQVNNIVAILNAYPAVRIKVGGYTDKTGNDAANKKLSQERADAVMNAIRSAGGKAGQLTGAEGYGSEFAKVPATASDEERKKDRRIALQLNSK